MTAPDLARVVPQPEAYRVCWYSRAGHVDLFPMLSQELQENGRAAHSHFVCHNRLEAERLATAHGQANVSVLGVELRENAPGPESSAARIHELEQAYPDIPLIRCAWSELFEKQLDDQQLMHHLIGHYDFWERTLLNHRTEVLVSEMPSILSTAVAWTVCKRLGVQFISFVDIAVLGDRMVLSGSWTADFEGFDTALTRGPEPTSEAYGRATAFLERALTCPAKTAEVQRKLKERPYERLPLSFRRVRNLKSFLERERKRKDYYVYNGGYDWLRTWSLAHARLRFHRMINVFDAVNSDPDRRYFLLPLHQKNEWSDYAWMGLDYADPATLVWKVSASLPLGRELYVKEHVAGFGDRSLSCYRTLKQFRATRVLHPNEDTVSLLRRADAVVTLGSSLGFEAVLIGKPVILLGEAWYRHCPGVHRATTPEQLAALMQDARNLPVASHEEKLSILQALYAISFEGYKVPDDRALTPDNVRRLASALHARIEDNRRAAPNLAIVR